MHTPPALYFFPQAPDLTGIQHAPMPHIHHSPPAHLTGIQRSADATHPPVRPQGNSALAAIQRSADGPPPPVQTTQSPHIQKNTLTQNNPLQQKILPSILQISLTKDTVYTSNINYPPNHHTNLSLPQPTHRTDCRRDGCMVGTRCVGVSRWSYLAPGASDGKVLCGHKPQSKPHLSEPGTHQRTWRVMGRPARQNTQTLSMTRRNDRTRHDHAAAPPAVRPSLPTHKKKSPKKAQKRGVPR